MTLLKFMPRPERILIAAVSITLLLAAVSPAPADAHAIRDEIRHSGPAAAGTSTVAVSRPANPTVSARLAVIDSTSRPASARRMSRTR